MEVLKKINTTRIKQSRIDEVDFQRLEFGAHTTDHMLVNEYMTGKWQEPRILPFEDFSISPASLSLHYGQTVFEGMKAFRMKKGSINIFRIDKHFERFNLSLERMCMPPVSQELFYEGLGQLIAIDRAWVPDKPGTALYIRPFMIATEARLGVKISEEYKFMIICGPVPDLYAKPIKVKVERHFTRAAPGGTGYAKCGGNYGASFYPTKLARAEGYDQVLWTDATQHAFIEESGMMNVLFVINNELVTAPLSDSILDGVTRDSLLTLAGDLGIPHVERPISVQELREAFAEGTISEAFGAGTAAVVAPIELINIDNSDYRLPVTESSVSSRLKKQLEEIRTGVSTDIHGWNYIIE